MLYFVRWLFVFQQNTFKSCPRHDSNFLSSFYNFNTGCIYSQVKEKVDNDDDDEIHITNEEIKLRERFSSSNVRCRICDSREQRIESPTE